jgi:PemK-like, MazF-like toxin of type II toxin-antitoxin system
MTDFNFGDIVPAPFPLTDQSAVKKRPAVIVSSAAYNLKRPNVIIMAVTSQMRSASSFGDTAIADWRSAGLLKPSVLKPIFTTVEKGLMAAAQCHGPRHFVGTAHPTPLRSEQINANSCTIKLTIKGGLARRR